MPGFDRAASSAASCGSVFSQEPERSGTFRSVPPSGTLSSASPSTTLTARLWGADLHQGLPRVLSNDGVEAVRGELTRIRVFLSEEFSALTQERTGAISNPAMANAKGVYLQACDLIEMQHHGRTVGVIIGAPEDWSTYYIRIFAILQAYQRPALGRRFVRECVFEPLTALHVERVVADTSPANLAMSRGFSELHFHVTGQQLTERWGPLVRYTRFLDSSCEAAFRERFGGGAPPGSAGPRKEEGP